jgi:hypothetical protein
LIIVKNNSGNIIKFFKLSHFHLGKIYFVSQPARIFSQNFFRRAQLVMKNFPVEIIKIIINYISDDDILLLGHNSVESLNITPVVEKFIGEKELQILLKDRQHFHRNYPLSFIKKLHEHSDPQNNNNNIRPAQQNNNNTQPAQLDSLPAGSKASEEVYLFLRGAKLTEEFVNKNSVTIASYSDRASLWKIIASNPSISSIFLLNELKKTNFRVNRQLHFALLEGIMRHSSFLTLWREYMKYTSVLAIMNVLTNVLTKNSSCTSNVDNNLPPFQICKEFITTYPGFARIVIEYCKDADEQLMEWLENKKKEIFFYPDQILKNKYIGEDYIQKYIQKNFQEERKEKYKRLLNENHSLSSKFWEQHLDLACWNDERGDERGMTIACNPNLSIDFISRHKDKLNLVHLFKHNNLLPIYFMRQTFENFLKKV